MADFACPKCGRQMSRPDSMVEQAGTCPHCGHVGGVRDNGIPQTGDEHLALEPAGNRRAKLLKRLAVLTAVLAVGIVVALLAWPEQDDAAQAKAYGRLGFIHGARGRLDEAERMYRKSLEIFERLGQPEGMVDAYRGLGVIYEMRGQFDEAEQVNREILKIEERLGRQEGMAEAYNALGVICSIRGKLDEAEQMYRKALEIDERLGSQVGVATGYANLGKIYKTRGKLNEAREFGMKARDLYARIGMPRLLRLSQSWLDELDAEHPTSGPATRSRE